MGNNNQTSSTSQEKFSCPPNQNMAGGYPYQNMGINYVGKKEDGWRNGHCTRCGKSSFMCMCTGNLKEAAWTNGKCNKCGKTTFMCNCPDISTLYFGPGPLRPSSAQQVGYIAQSMGYSGRKEDGWRDGNCTRCGKTTFMCNCTGSNREFFWKNGNCEKCGKTAFMCICPKPSQKIDYPEQSPFNQPSLCIPAQPIGMNDMRRKEDGWRDGKCLRCGKSSFMCDCIGCQKEAFWENGNCRRCGRSSFMCQCSN